MQTTLFTYAGISVLFAVTCYGNSGTRIPWNADVASNRCNFDLELHEGAATNMLRIKRGTSKIPKVVTSGAAVMRGMYATNLILDGAKPVLMTELRQVYVKPGGYMAALNDFRSLEPTSSQMLVLNDQITAIGQVGDRIIHLMADKVSKNGKVKIKRRRSQSNSWEIEVDYSDTRKNKKKGKSSKDKKGWFWNKG